MAPDLVLPHQTAYSSNKRKPDPVSISDVGFGSVTIPPGMSIITIPVTLVDDNIAEPDETIELQFTNNSIYRLGTSRAIATIVDNEPRVTIAATDAAAAEQGSDAGTFTVTRTAEDISTELMVNYNLSGTAQQGSDYIALSGTVTIPAGSDTATILVTPIDDALGEPDETVVVQLISGTSYGITTPGSATLTIMDNEPRVKIVATDPDAAEQGLDRGTFIVSHTGSQAAILTEVSQNVLRKYKKLTAAQSNKRMHPTKPCGFCR